MFKTIFTKCKQQIKLSRKKSFVLTLVTRGICKIENTRNRKSKSYVLNLCAISGQSQLRTTWIHHGTRSKSIKMPRDKGFICIMWCILNQSWVKLSSRLPNKMHVKRNKSRDSFNKSRGNFINLDPILHLHKSRLLKLSIFIK